MTKENQKKLYIHFVALAKAGKTPKIRTRAAARAANLLRIYPDFEIPKDTAEVEKDANLLDEAKEVQEELEQDNKLETAEEPKPKKKKKAVK